jgi:two-component system NtrC family sensor kinase
MLEFKYPSRSLYCYSATFLTAGLSVALWHYEETILAAAALGITFISLLSSRFLMRTAQKATEQKRHLDQQLIQSQKLAAIGELSSGIAHEINNPLAIIGQETEWMRHLLKKDSFTSPEADQEVRDSLQEIVRQVDRCKEITHKLLDFARKKEPLIQKADVNRLIEDMARLVEKEAQQKNIKIIRNYQRDLPRVQTDPPLLRQVVLNLLNNATYAVEKDGAITISTRESANRSIELIFEDTGCGIPKEHIDKIFDPFFTTKPTGKGTGLGLSISHGIITKLGGCITVASEAGKGTAFTIQLPEKPPEGEE